MLSAATVTLQLYATAMQKKRGALKFSPAGVERCIIMEQREEGWRLEDGGEEGEQSWPATQPWSRPLGHCNPGYTLCLGVRILRVHEMTTYPSSLHPPAPLFLWSSEALVLHGEQWWWLSPVAVW